MEKYVESEEILSNIFLQLKDKPKTSNYLKVERLIKNIIENGIVFNTDFEDLIYYLDSRLDSYIIKELFKIIGIEWGKSCYRPKSISNSVSLFNTLSLEQVTYFLILIERIGFQIDPILLVDHLLKNLKDRSKKIFSEYELEIYWYYKVRHKNYPFSFTTRKNEFVHKEIEFKTSTGYLIEKMVNINKEFIKLRITPPKYRKQRKTISTVCNECGLEWQKGDPSSSAYHRKQHKKKMLLYDPKPNDDFIKELSTNKDAEFVNHSSPKWKHKEIYLRALEFKREFQYDFVQWESAKGVNDVLATGFLFANQIGTIIGACAFRNRTLKGESNLWVLDWIWICPKERRKGHLSKRWKDLRDRFGDFIVSSPVSDNMKAFLKKKDDLHLINHPNERL